MVDVYNKILVAIDGSEQSFEALKKAIEASIKNEAKLFLITVINTSSWSTDAQIYQLLLSESKNMGEDTISKAKKQIPKDIEYHTELLNGNPKSGIVQFAKENDIDLVILGATGKGAITRVLVGSTSAYVVNHAPCDVLIVR